MGTALSCAERTRVIPRAGAGAYRVGCADLMLKDGKDGDSGVFMRVFYPVDHEDDEKQPIDADYPVWMDRKEYISGLAAFLKQSQRRLQFVSDWIIGEKRSPALWLRPLAGTSSSSLPISTSLPEVRSSSHLASSKSFHSLASSPSYPVVIFSHGLAGCRHIYSSYCASLAAFGFVVAAVEHRDYSACWTYKLIPDALSGRAREREITMRILESGDKEFKIRNQQLSKRVSEAVKALHVMEELQLGQMNPSNILVGNEFDWTQFKGRLNLSRASIAGHSFGGATALAATAFSTDFQAAVVLDGWMFPLEADHYERAAQPTLFLNAGKFQWKHNLKSMKRFNEEVAERPMYNIRDGSHQSFTDFSLLVGPFFGKRLNLQGDTDPIITMEAIVETSVAFLRQVHEGQSVTEKLRELVRLRYSAFIEEGPGRSLESEPVSHI